MMRNTVLLDESGGEEIQENLNGKLPGKVKFKGRLILKNIEKESLIEEKIYFYVPAISLVRLIQVKGEKAVILLEPDNEDSLYTIKISLLGDLYFNTGFDPFTKKQKRFEIPVIWDRRELTKIKKLVNTHIEMWIHQTHAEFI